MHTTITARHCDISDELRERAQAVLRRLGGITTRPVDATVVFDRSASLCTAEIRLHVAKGDVFVTTGEAADHLSALDRAEEKLRRQVEKAPPHPGRGRRALKDQV